MKTHFKTIGLAFLLGYYVVASDAIISAFFQPSHRVVLVLNAFNEMGIEFVFTILSIPFVLYFTYDYFKSKRENMQISKVKETQEC